MNWFSHVVIDEQCEIMFQQTTFLLQYLPASFDYVSLISGGGRVRSTMYIDKILLYNMDQGWLLKLHTSDGS